MRKTLKELDSGWRIDIDNRTLILVKTYEYDKVDKETKKKTGEVGTKEEKWYYPTINQCLKKYVDELGKYEKDYQSVIDRLDVMYKMIEEMPLIYTNKGKIYSNE